MGYPLQLISFQANPIQSNSNGYISCLAFCNNKTFLVQLDATLGEVTYNLLSSKGAVTLIA